MILLVVMLECLCFRFRLGQGSQSVLVKRFNDLCAAHREIEAVTGGGDLLEQRLVQARLHGVAGVVFQIIRPPFGVADRKQFSVSRSDADGEDFQARVRRFARCFDGIGILVFAVRHQHEHLVPVAFLECRCCGFNRLGDGRAALRECIHIQHLHALPERRIVNRHGALQKRTTRERHQAEPVRLGGLHEINRRKFGARQPVGCDVLGEHGLRRVNRHDDVQSLDARFFQRESPLWSRQCHEQCRTRNGEQNGANQLPLAGDAHGQVRQQSRLDERGEQPLPRASRPPKEQP